MKFSLLYKFSFLSYFSLKIVIFSWVVGFLENISAFSLKQDLACSHQSLAEEMTWPEESYKIGSVCPSLLSACTFSMDWIISFFWNFEHFKKIPSLVLSGICVKSKFLWFINILRKLHAWEKSSSQVKDKNGSQPMRFQYSLIISISLID